MQGSKKLLVLAALAVLSASAAMPASAQRGGGGGGGGGMGGGGRGGMGPGPGMPGSPVNIPGGPVMDTRRDSSNGPPPASGSGGGANSTMRGGLQLGPPGRWWDDKSFAKSLKLRPDQQSRMDAIFEQNRPALVSRYQNLQQAESQMEETTRVPNPEEAALFTSIDRVAQARAELEKASAHYLLLIRKEMDPDQIDRLEKHR